MLRHLIILSGSLVESPLLRHLLRDANHIVAADGGCDHARRLGLMPDQAVGDLDSISAEGLAWLQTNRIPVRVFPPEKNATDSELAVETALAAVPGGTAPEAVELVLLGALGSRPDHVLGNQSLAAALAAKGYRVLISDGISLLYALHGPASLTLDLEHLPAGEADTEWAVSTIALSPLVTGLTYSGLKYPLDRYTLHFGSSRGISNEPEPRARVIQVRFDEGLALFCLTPRH